VHTSQFQHLQPSQVELFFARHPPTPINLRPAKVLIDKEFLYLPCESGNVSFSFNLHGLV
jgi:hypothetical protein